MASSPSLPLVTCALLLLLAVACQAHPYWPLELAYYRDKCPQAEAVVKAVVGEAVRQNPGNGAAVIRMLFHDCFVELASMKWVYVIISF
uniref:Plant heme peroxidase family profile domain-containing protein n=1 Tax=Oryza nivara TaxID=4536 RepID=A0A0E0GMU2_ORYNI